MRRQQPKWTQDNILANRIVADMKKDTGSGLLHVRVECYAGYRGEQRPLRFYLKMRCIEVVEVIDQWYGPDYRYCKVRGDDNGTYILRHAMADGYWELTMFSHPLHANSKRTDESERK